MLHFNKNASQESVALPPTTRTDARDGLDTQKPVTASQSTSYETTSTRFNYGPTLTTVLGSGTMGNHRRQMTNEQMSVSMVKTYSEEAVLRCFDRRSNVTWQRLIPKENNTIQHSLQHLFMRVQTTMNVYWKLIVTQLCQTRQNTQIHKSMRRLRGTMSLHIHHHPIWRQHVQSARLPRTYKIQQ